VMMMMMMIMMTTTKATTLLTKINKKYFYVNDCIVCPGYVITICSLHDNDNYVRHRSFASTTYICSYHTADASGIGFNSVSVTVIAIAFVFCLV
jgi:hypothetical protein